MPVHTDVEKILLMKVNQIGLEPHFSAEENLVFIRLSPYLDSLMALLKLLTVVEMQALFIQYPGVRQVMSMIEEEAQKLEAALGIEKTGRLS